MLEENKNNSNQFTLALNDLESLQASVRELKGRQLQILLIGLPIFLALLGPAFALILYPEKINKIYIGENEVILFAPWLFLLPITSLILSFAFLAIFFQKSTSIRRQEAYILLLQRYCSYGKFPEGYRGWVDTYAKYNQRIRTCDTPTINFANQISFWNIAPSGAFPLLAGFIFSVIPLISWFLTVKLSERIFPLNGEGGNWTFILIVLISGALVFASYYFITKYICRANNGKKSFRYFICFFEEILNDTSPYDPERKP